MRRRHVAFFAVLVILIGGLGVSGWLDAHPFAFRAPPDASRAFIWDTTAEIIRRGSCAPGGGSLDPDWRPQPGRYLLTMLIADGPNRWRKIRGRLWLASVDAKRAGSAQTILRGATDLDFSRAFAPTTFKSPLSPPARSTDPAAPGVVVHRDSATNAITLIMGSGAPVIELRIDQGVSDGFAGSWRGGDSTVQASGYFCAGWIEV